VSAGEQPPEQEPRPGDDERPDTVPPEPAPAPKPPDKEIEDPLERDQIKYASEERILGVTLDGPKVGSRSIDVFTLGEFLAQVDRVVRALTAAAEGISLGAAGRIPRPPDAAPWRTRGLVFESSATIDFVLGEPETMRISPEGEVTSPTIEAVVALGRLVGFDAAEAVAEVREYEDRIGTDFAHLLSLIADNDLASRWEPIRTPPVDVASERADRVRNALRAELDPSTSVVTVTGFLFRLDAKRNDFRLQPEDGPAIVGTYDDALIPQMRDAWSHRVVAELTRTEHRYAYATRPHRIDHTVRRIVRKLGPVEAERVPRAK
jgi:hypothetical protein